MAINLIKRKLLEILSHFTTACGRYPRFALHKTYFYSSLYFHCHQLQTLACFSGVLSIGSIVDVRLVSLDSLRPVANIVQLEQPVSDRQRDEAAEEKTTLGEPSGSPHVSGNWSLAPERVHVHLT